MRATIDQPLGVLERLRLAALDSYAILKTAPEPEYDAFVRRAAQRFATPMSTVSLIDDRRQWFKARVGIDVRHTPREIAFCIHTFDTKQPLVVADATRDDRFADNPLVTGAPHIRFYAGAPLITPLGRVLGTLNVMDTRSRHLWTPGNTAELVALAAEVVAQLEQRRSALVRARARTEAPAVVRLDRLRPAFG